MFIKPRSFIVFFLLQVLGNPAFAAVPEAFNDFQKNWLGFSGNFDVGYRQTQFYEGNHNIALG